MMEKQLKRMAWLVMVLSLMGLFIGCMNRGKSSTDEVLTKAAPGRVETKQVKLPNGMIIELELGKLYQIITSYKNPDPHPLTPEQQKRHSELSKRLKELELTQSPNKAEHQEEIQRIRDELTQPQYSVASLGWTSYEFHWYPLNLTQPRPPDSEAILVDLRDKDESARGDSWQIVGKWKVANNITLPAPDVAKAAIEAANRYTGFNELQNVVDIKAEQVVIKEEEDDTPFSVIHSRIVGRPLIRVTYTASLPEWHPPANFPDQQVKRNPYIQAFDVLLDAKDLSLLKIASKWADNLNHIEKHKKGAHVSRKQIARDIYLNPQELPREFPKVRPIDFIKRGPGEHINNKHMEWYYAITGKNYIPADKRNLPVWVFITHGMPPGRPIGGPVPITMEEVKKLFEQYRLGYVRTAKYWVINALTDEILEDAGMFDADTANL